MAYIVARRSGKWEVRESRMTPSGPRSRTLATFSTLTPEVVELARARSSKPLQESDLHRAAQRVGAPIAVPVAERLVRDLLAQLTAGQMPPPILRHLLADALARDAYVDPSDSSKAAVEWVSATPHHRAEVLRDLLLLADRLPVRDSPSGRFPRIASKYP